MFTFTQDYALIKKWIGDSKVLSGFATEMFGKINSNSYIFGTLYGKLVDEIDKVITNKKNSSFLA